MLKLEKLIGEVITIKSINGDEIVAVLIGESDRDKVITVTNPKQVLINNSEVVLTPFALTAPTDQVNLKMTNVFAVMKSFPQTAKEYLELVAADYEELEAESEDK